MRKSALVLAGFLLTSKPIFAADITTTTCPGAGCVDYITANGSTAAIQLTGTFSGTITFQASVDKSTFVSAGVINAGTTAPGTRVTTATTTGIFIADVRGFQIFRVVFTGYTSGTATVTTSIVPR